MLANAVYQAMAMALTDRVRGQARSYSGFVSSPNFASDATSVGAGLLANAVYQAMAMAMALTDRVRGQARSYSGFGSSPKCRVRRHVRRSRLAGERGVSGNGDGAERSRSRASALLQWVWVIAQFRVRRHVCRSRLAGDLAVSADIHVCDGPGSPASRLLQVSPVSTTSGQG